MSKSIKIMQEVMPDGSLRLLDEFKGVAEELGQKPGDFIETSIKVVGKKRARTAAEQASIEVYCNQVSVKCNEGGITLREIARRFRDFAEVPCSQAGIKEAMFKAMMWHCFDGMTSTTDLDKTQAHHVWLWCDQFTQDNFNFSIPWPSKKDDS